MTKVCNIQSAIVRIAISPGKSLSAHGKVAKYLVTALATEALLAIPGATVSHATHHCPYNVQPKQLDPCEPGKGKEDCKYLVKRVTLGGDALKLDMHSE